MTDRIKETSDDILSLCVEKTLYDSDTVLITANKFTDRFYINVQHAGDQIMISLKPKSKETPMEGRVLDDFLNELIDQQARVIVQKECGHIRDLIVQKAFSPLR